MAVVDLRALDLTRILKEVRRLVRFPLKRMSLDYDAEADVLYISFRRPQHATDTEMREDGILVHRRGKQVVGLTVLEASTRGGRHSPYRLLGDSAPRKRRTS